MASEKSLTAHIRRLSADTDYKLYVRFSMAEIAAAGLVNGQPIAVMLDGRTTVFGVLKLTANNPWLSPGEDGSNAEISTELRRAGLK